MTPTKAKKPAKKSKKQESDDEYSSEFEEDEGGENEGRPCAQILRVLDRDALGNFIWSLSEKKLNIVFAGNPLNLGSSACPIVTFCFLMPSSFLLLAALDAYFCGIWKITSDDPFNVEEF